MDENGAAVAQTASSTGTARNMGQGFGHVVLTNLQVQNRTQSRDVSCQTVYCRNHTRLEVSLSTNFCQPETMSLEPGTTLGPYSVTAKIGEGGMGEVYRARDTKLDRDVALKVLPQAFTDDPDRLA